jgi:hypothetical protein
VVMAHLWWGISKGAPDRSLTRHVMAN